MKQLVNMMMYSIILKFSNVASFSSKFFQSHRGVVFNKNPCPATPPLFRYSSHSYKLPKGSIRTSNISRRNSFHIFMTQSSSSSSFTSYNSTHERYYYQNDEMKAMTQEEISDIMNSMYLLDYDWKQSSSSHDAIGKIEIPPPVMYSAVCIIPPDDAWDSIQRARFLARDHTMYRWPPAIRLFHPFPGRPYLASAASAIAELIEKHNIEPFDITLDKLVIRPHWEIVEEISENDDQEMASKTLEEESGEEKELTDIEKLILDEERKGKERFQKRMMKKKMQEEQSGQVSEDYTKQETNTAENQISKKNSNKLNQKQKSTKKKNKKKKEDYTGPCIICLEPNDESKSKLEELRKLLKDELFAPYDSFSISSALSSSDDTMQPSFTKTDGKKSLFKPSITLGTFSTTDKAAKTARRIQRNWEPLTFNVADIQLLSRDGTEQSDASHTKELNSYSTSQYECDAIIMFMGEEIETMENDSEALLSLLFEAGEDGGGAASLDYKEVSPEEKRLREERSAMLRNMLDEENSHEDDDGDELDEFWFDDEDDEDYEGATIVLGRTQFFLGEMRLYVGMPASNPIDNKDRVLGQGVSASVRRRGSTHRKGVRYKSGDYGSKESDYLSKSERLRNKNWNLGK